MGTVEGCTEDEALADEGTKEERVCVPITEEGSVCDTSSGTPFGKVYIFEDVTSWVPIESASVDEIVLGISVLNTPCGAE